MKQKLNYNSEYININGYKHFLMNYPSSNKDANVLLFVHGGPGMAESIFSHSFQGEFVNLFNVVYWDQKGAGKTLTCNKKQYPTMEEELDDLNTLVEYLKKKYNKEKIIILGHSFGSILSSLYILKHPENILYYIGAGQVISIVENEKAGYDKLKELIINSNNQKDLNKLNKLGKYPEDSYNKIMIKKIQQIRILQGKYKIGMNFKPILKSLFSSPIFKLSDIKALVNGMSNNLELWDYMYSHSLDNESHVYKVPVYYICGDNDYQAPITIAKNYFKNIQAPKKELYMLKDAGHFMMLDQSKQFAEVLKEIEK